MCRSVPGRQRPRPSPNRATERRRHDTLSAGRVTLRGVGRVVRAPACDLRAQPVSVNLVSTLRWFTTDGMGAAREAGHFPSVVPLSA